MAEPVTSAEPVKYKLSNFELKNLLKDTFNEKYNSLGFSPISIILIKENKNDEGKVINASLISLSIENATDIKEKIVYISTINQKDVSQLKQFIDLLEKG
ncbi:MAG: hypothetical protein WC492_03200 [Candidatus Micrarchaeia archaeon]